MNRAEIEVLLKTIYSGEGAAKAVADLDKISASGKKVAGSLKLAKKEASEVFAGVSASTRARNPQLFGPSASGGGLGVPPVIPPPFLPTSSASAPGSSGGGAGGGSSTKGAKTLLDQFGARLFSRALSITSGILIYAVINAITRVFGAITKGLSAVGDEARKLYAKALTSGLGLQFTTKRALLAQVLGVSEKDVFQFGQAVGFLSDRLKPAEYFIAKSTPEVAAVAYQFKILEASLSGLFATLVEKAGPSLIVFADGLSKLINVITSFIRNNPLITKLIELNFVGLKELGKLLGGKDSGPAPNPVAYMQQIHASALEHMGLIVGGLGGAQDFPAQTATNTKKTAEAVTKIANKISGSGGSRSFGDSLLYSMP